MCVRVCEHIEIGTESWWGKVGAIDTEVSYGDFGESQPTLILLQLPFVQVFVAQYLHISSTTLLCLTLRVYER